MDLEDYLIAILILKMLHHKITITLTDTPGLSDTPGSQENFRFGRNLVQMESRPTQVTTM